MTTADLLVRIRAESAETAGTYPLEAELSDGSRIDAGVFVLDQARLDGSEYAADPAEYGRLLFGALFTGSIGEAYRRAVPAPDADGMLRIRMLIDSDAPEINGVRWERLYRERRGAWVPMAVAGDTPFSRYRALPAAEPTPVASLPIRILVAVANPDGLPAGLQPIEVEREIDTFREAVRESARTDDLEVTILHGRSPLSEALRRKLEQDGFTIAEGATTITELVRRLPTTHVVHVIGHGGFQEDRDGGSAQSVLYLEGDDGQADPTTADQVVQAFAAADAIPALVYLSACRTGQNTMDRVHPFVGLAPRLVDAGVAAVVAMQADVPVAVARTLTRSFYTRVLEHGVVDVAMNEARAAVAADAQDHEWTIPVLVTRLRQGRLFVANDLAQRVVAGDIAIAPGAEHGVVADRFEAPPEPRPRPAPVLHLPRDFASLVGRSTEVQEALANLGAGESTEFYGSPGSGKSVLLRHIANRAAGLVPAGVLYLARGTEPLYDQLQFLFDSLYEADASLRPSDADLEEYLAACEALVVIDDADVDRETLARLITVLPAARFVVAAGARNLWGDDGAAVGVAGLAPADGLLLFAAGLGRKLDPGEEPRVAELCASLDGHPLHILQAADRILREGWPAMDAAPPVPAGEPAAPTPAAPSPPASAPGPEPVGDAVPSVDASRLGETDRRVLGLVAAAGAPLRLDRIRALVPSPDVDESCASLERARLIRAASPRYVLTEPLPAATLDALDVPAWRARLLEHLVVWVEQNRNSPEILVRDIDTILAFLDERDAATGVGQDQALTLRLARGSEGALILAKRWERWASTLELEERIASAAGNQEAIGWVRHQQGSRSLALRDDAAARASLEDALRIREGLGDRAGARVTRHNLDLLGPVAPPGRGNGGKRSWRRWLRRPYGPAALAVGMGAIVIVGAAVAFALRPVPGPTTSLPIAAFDRSTIDAGTVQLGQQSEVALAVTNASDIPMTISRVDLEPAVDDLELQDGCTGPIEPRATCTIVVLFAPTAEGDRGTVLVIDDNTLETHHDIPVAAVGAAPPGLPAITIDPQAVEFGPVPPGSPARATITITSSGEAALEIFGIDPPATTAFSVIDDACTGQILDPSAACQVDIGFSAAGLEPVQDTLVIHDSAAEGSHAVSLSGSGYQGLPDLLIKFSVIGDFTFDDFGSATVPVVVSVRNEGDADAAPFRIGAQAAIIDPPEGPYAVALTADPSDEIDSEDGWRPATVRPLGAGQSIEFRARLKFGLYLQNRFVNLTVVADSCAGEEIFDPVAIVHCRVVERDEQNNVSDPLPYMVPALELSSSGWPPAGQPAMSVAAAGADRRNTLERI